MFPQIESKQSLLEFSSQKLRINYRLIIVRCRRTKLQFFLVVCIFLLFVVWSSGNQIHVCERINKRPQISFRLKRRQRKRSFPSKRTTSQTMVKTTLGLFWHWNTKNHISVLNELSDILGPKLGLTQERAKGLFCVVRVTPHISPKQPRKRC